MTQVFGREREKKLLEKTLEKEEAQLLAVYGRRRIGKTYLITEYFKSKGFFFELTGILKGTKKEQLWNFSRALTEAFDLKTPPPTQKTWQKAFSLLLENLKTIPEEKKVILFIDELPWLMTPRSDLLRMLEHTWNRYLSRRKNLIMILCGSSASWMIKKIVHNRGGLYGRLTQKLHLEPFSLHETENYLKEKKNIVLDRKQITEIYMVTGGIAKYLDQVERGLSSEQIIQELCFSKNGFLKDEFASLFSSLFDNSERHMSIVRAIGKSHKGLTLTQIAKELGKGVSGHLSSAIADLEATGFIHFLPFFGKRKRDGLYRLIDEYSLFYLSWMDGNTLNSNFKRSHKFISWTGYAFENICIKHAKQIIKSLEISVVVKNLSYWTKPCDETPGAQADLIIERTDRCINLVEIKFCEDEFIMSQEYGRTLTRRRHLFYESLKSKRTVFNTLITSFGAAKTPAFLNAIDQQLKLDALFS
ncbi:MAG: hypothetical protein ChlgKO_05700 [Chlamydiales bacterium]